MRRICALALAAIAWTAAPAAKAAEPIVIKFSHVVAPDTPKGKAAEMFKKLAEERTKGAVKVEVYPNSQLYKDKEELEALQIGAVQMLAPSLSKFGPLGVKEFEVFDLPYIFPSREVLRAVTEGPVGQSLMRKLEAKGIRGLGIFDNGFKIMTANSPVRLPGDVKGLKLRIQSSKVLDAQMRALGALPQSMAFSEVYQALQTGVVDGTENTPSNTYTQKVHEVQKYGAVTNHGYIGYALITNKKFWDGLPADLRATLEGAANESVRFANAIAQQENDDALAAMKASGKIELYQPTKEELEQWRKALLPVHQQVIDRIGDNILQAIYKEAETFGFKN